MIVSTILNLFFVPALYVMFEQLRERVAPRAPVADAEPPPNAAPNHV